jgi:hypothetical protein
MNDERKLLKKKVQGLNQEQKDIRERLNQTAIKKSKAEL